MGRQIEVEVNDEASVVVEVTYYQKETSTKLTGHPDSWEEGEPAELEYQVISVGLFSEEEEEEEELSKEAAEQWVSDNSEAVDIQVLKELEG